MTSEAEWNMRANTLEGRIPDDLIREIYSFCSFKDILAMTSTSRGWYGLCTRDLDACDRFPYKPQDRGTGLAVALDLDRNDWKPAVLAREIVYNNFVQESHAFTQLEAIAKLLEGPVVGHHIIEEACRWIVFLFDKHDFPNACEFSDVSLQSLVDFAKTSSKIQSAFHIVVKALGVLALHENNRRRMSELKAIHAVIAGAKNYITRGEVISNVCWAMVIFARPLGAVEGSTFLHTHMQNAVNIGVIVEQKGIDLVLDAIRHNSKSAETLAKAFWCMVNMSLYEEHKQILISSGAVELILNALCEFPDHKELQYRACFAIINLAIKANVKDMIRELNGIRLVIEGMRRFPGYLSYQRCACVVLRSLAWNSAINARTICELDGAEQIRSMMQQFSEDRDMVRLGLTALQCLNA